MANFIHTNDFSSLESCQLYITEKYKASNCCKIKAVIQRYSVKDLFLKILQNRTGKLLCQGLFFEKVAA